MTEVIVCCDFSHNGDNGGKKKGLRRESRGASPYFPHILFTASGIQWLCEVVQDQTPKTKAAGHNNDYFFPSPADHIFQ